jgi:phospholipase C
MLENRSFDHLLGGLAGIDGPAGGSNIDPADGSAVAVSFDAPIASEAEGRAFVTRVMDRRRRR